MAEKADRFNHGSDKKKKTILLVDDDCRELTILAECLRDTGYRIVMEQDARSALSEAKKGVDVIVTDHRIPEMDGMKFVEALRRTNSEIPVIMLTAHAGVDTYFKALSLGVFEYVNKPVGQEELKRIIHMALDSTHA